MELPMNAPIPDFAQKMSRLMKAVEVLVGSDDHTFKRDLMNAKNHAVVNEGNMIEIWWCSMRAFSSLDKGKGDSVFK